jgi:hypothetical protein
MFPICLNVTKLNFECKLLKKLVGTGKRKFVLEKGRKSCQIIKIMTFAYRYLYYLRIPSLSRLFLCHS